MNDIGDLNNSNLPDKLAALNRVIIGMIPYAGPALSEIICAFIPNQRLDRAIKYIQIINQKVEELSNTIKNNKNKINLIETGLRASANSTYDAKCEWIGNIVTNGLEDKIEVSIAESIINIVEELNNEQIVILYFYSNYYNTPIIESSKFKDRFKELFEPLYFQMNDYEKYKLLDNKRRLNIVKLIKLGLIENDIEIPRLPNFSVSNKYSKNEIEFIIQQIHELNEEIINYNNSEKYKPTNLGEFVIKTMIIKEQSL